MPEPPFARAGLHHTLQNDRRGRKEWPDVCFMWENFLTEAPSPKIVCGRWGQQKCSVTSSSSLRSDHDFIHVLEATAWTQRTVGQCYGCSCSTMCSPKHRDPRGLAFITIVKLPAPKRARVESDSSCPAVRAPAWAMIHRSRDKSWMVRSCYWAPPWQQKMIMEWQNRALFWKCKPRVLRGTESR